MFGLFNKNKNRGDWREANLAMGAAAPALEGVLDTFSTGEAGILVRPSPDQDGAQAEAEIARALEAVPESLARWRTALDESESPHPWVIVSSELLADLAASTRTVGEALAHAGMGPRVLAAVYPFVWRPSPSPAAEGAPAESALQERKIYWVYQPRIRAFTPFIPAETGEPEARDHQLELRVEKATRPDLPTSGNIKEWYPVWGMPF